MSRIRAQVTIPYSSGMPEDVVVNTFHFLTAGTPMTGGEQAALSTAIEAFYNGENSGAGSSIANALAHTLSRVANAVNIDYFDLAEAEPRVPVGSSNFTLGAAGQASTGPTEVALCASYTAEAISGVPQARRRGRIYIGPFNLAHLFERPSLGLRERLGEAGTGLISASGVAGAPWCVYSRVGDAFAQIISGWVDDEWDTMRSRGRRATTRTFF